MSNYRRSGEKERDKLLHLCELIQCLDSMVAFRRVRPDVIEDLFRAIQSKPLMEEWKGIRRHIEKIAYLPLTIPSVSHLMKLGMYMKLLIPISMISTTLFVARRLHPKLLPLTIIDNPIFFIAAGLLSISSAVAFIAIDFTIRRKVIKFEREHEAKYSRGRERVKGVAQKLILKLARDVKNHRENPNDYKMELFHGDYKGVKIVKRKTKNLRVFPRKYATYIVIPSESAA